MYDATDDGYKSWLLAIETMQEIWDAWTVSGICAFNVRKP